MEDPAQPAAITIAGITFTLTLATVTSAPSLYKKSECITADKEAKIKILSLIKEK